KPAPKVAYFRAPLSSASLKYPNRKAKEFSYQYSAPNAQVNSRISSPNPPGASPKDLNIPENHPISRYSCRGSFIKFPLLSTIGSILEGTNNFVVSPYTVTVL